MRSFAKPPGVLSGFHATDIDEAVPELIHAGEKWVSPEFRVSWREHRKWEFYFQVDGVTRWQSRKSQHDVGPGDLLITPPRLAHAQLNPPDARHHYFYAQIDLEKVCRRCPELRKAFDPRDFIYKGNAGSIAVPFRQLIREVALDLPLRAHGLRLAVDTLVVEAARILAEAPGHSLILGHPAVQRARELMDRRPRENWPVPALARLAGLSASRLNESFRAELGLSPHQYLLRLRAELGAQALGQTDRAITDIALDLGFSSSQHFAQVFRKYFGLSARDYRHRNTEPHAHLTSSARSI
jgi:AraC-like DNA-binding protein